MSDQEPLGPSETSVIIKALKKSGLLEKLITWLVVALIGGGASMATRQVSDSNHLAEAAELKEQLARLEAEQVRKWKSYYDRHEEERLRLEARRVYIERRFSRLEAKLGVEAPPAEASEQH